MNRMLTAYDRWVHRLHAPAAEILALTVRATLGWLFIDSGWQKLHNLTQIISFFQSLGIPAAAIQAPMVASIELVGGVCILLGLFTRIASLPLMGTMIVAIITARKDDLHSFADLIGFIEFLYLGLLLYLFVYGAGRLSADRALCKQVSRGKKVS